MLLMKPGFCTHLKETYRSWLIITSNHSLSLMLLAMLIVATVLSVRQTCQSKQQYSAKLQQ